MKILLLVTGLGLGGAERQVVALADEYARRGHAVLLVSLTNDAQVMPSHPQVKVLHVGMKKSPAGFIAAFLALRRIIAGFTPDVVHSHMVHANIFARLIRLGVHIPRLVCSAHSTNEGGALRMLAYRLTDRLADITTNVSEEAVAAYIQKKAAPQGRIIALGNGIDTEAFRFDQAVRDSARASLGIPAHTKMILAVGRLSEPKDYPNLLNAFSQLEAVLPDTRLLIAGPGPLQEMLQQQIRQLGLEQKATLLGMRTDVFSLYCAADVYAMSSAWEGMPLVILEAMACERVVVATDCGGVKEVMADTGILVAPHDTPALATALNRALCMSEYDRSVIGHAARQRILEHYSLEAVADKWLLIYSGHMQLEHRVNP